MDGAQLKFPAGAPIRESMRLLARLVVTFAVLLITVPAAVAHQTAVREKPADTGKPVKPGDEETETPTDEVTEGEDPGGKPGKPDKEKPEKDKAKKERPEKDVPSEEAEDVPDHPLGGPPGQLKDPGEPAHPEHTDLGQSVAAAPSEGKLKVKTPGGEGFTELDADAPLPLGSVVDATEGLIEIGSEAPDGTEQNAVVGGGVFRISQDATGLTDLSLKGGDFSDCKRGVTARAAAKNKGRGQVARGLWAAGKGRFRTNGRNATASVRGTRWAVVDRCNSTTVKVFDGVVDVKDRSTGRTVVVRAGERHVARERRP